MSKKSFYYLIFWGFLIGFCAYLIPYFSNDYRYMLIQGSDTPVKSFGDIFVSQYRHYFEWGGRTVAHTIAQILLYLGKIPSAIASGLCFITLVLFIYFHGFSQKASLKNLRFLPLVFITMGLWLCLRIFGEVVFMLVSSCNYMFTTTLILIFLLPFRLSIQEKKYEGSILFAVGMFFFGIAAGWCNENTGFAICFMTGLLGLWLLKTKRLLLWHVSGGIGLGIGFLLLALSPGNEARLEFMEDNGFDFWGHLPKAISIFNTTLLEHLPLLLVLCFLLFKILRKSYHKKYAYDFYGALWLFGIALSSIFIMIFSPNFPARAATPFTIFTIASILSLANIFYKEKENIIPHKLKVISLVLAIAYFVPTMGNTIYAYTLLNEDAQKRVNEILEQKDKGIDNLVVKPFRVMTSKYVFVGDLRAQKQYFANLIIAKYYGVNSIRRSCNYDFPSTASHDYAFFARINKDGVCSLDRGDPEDPNDELNKAYLKAHPDIKPKFDFKHYKKN